MNLTPKDGFPYYFELAKNNSVQFIFKEITTIETLQNISEEKARFRYRPDKWNIKQVVGHITDHERIKMYRAFQLSRNESVELWGYDQESLVKNGRFNELTIKSLLTDFFNVRQSSISFIDTLSEHQLNIKGMARQFEITLEEFLRSIVGHEKHHIKIIQEKYQLE
ncbi:DinB family protein [Croceitalea rosinachiae]|uniref:DinB family protein n=1 Tax=Croceitalea rosinachiae TaxID=3075596 RepID=A0ABU3ABG5_9FLAO|nr:DinB family protein [Croceitalea sp. F388]MDT0606271.1 DinB family protein [Croceitalea sp. F388]